MQVIESKLRIEGALSSHMETFRIELERASYQADMGDMKNQKQISASKLADAQLKASLDA